MRKRLILCLTCALVGCSAMNNTDRGMLAGGLLGAGAGTVIGGANGKPGAGALIGAGTGAVLGGLIGNQEDKAERREAAIAQAHARQYPPLAIPDIVQLAHKHISDDIIIKQIHTTGSVYQLTPNEIAYLKSQGVSDRVVMEMQSRRATTIVPARQTVYVVDPPPPVSVGVGFGYGWGPRHHHHHRWCW